MLILKILILLYNKSIVTQINEKIYLIFSEKIILTNLKFKAYEYIFYFYHLNKSNWVIYARKLVCITSLILLINKTISKIKLVFHYVVSENLWHLGIL